MTKETDIFENLKFNEPFIEIYNAAFGKPLFKQGPRCLTMKGYANLEKNKGGASFSQEGDEYKKGLKSKFSESENIFELFSKLAEYRQERNKKLEEKHRDSRKKHIRNNFTLRYYDTLFLDRNFFPEKILLDLQMKGLIEGGYQGIVNKYLTHEDDLLDIDEKEHHNLHISLKRIYNFEIDPFSPMKKNNALTIFMKPVNVWFVDKNKFGSFQYRSTEKEVQIEKNSLDNKIGVETRLIRAEAILQFLLLNDLKKYLERRDKESYFSELLELQKSRGLLYKSSYVKEKNIVLEGVLLRENFDISSFKLK